MANKEEEWSPDAESYRDFYAHFLRYYRHYTPTGADRILDIGCGRWFPELLARYLHGHYCGVDPSFDHLEVSGDHILLPGNGENLSSLRDGWFDVVLLVSVLDHVQDVDKVLGEARRVLRVGGVAWVASTVLKNGNAEPLYRSHHTRYFTKKSLRTLVEQYFTKIKVFRGLYPNIVYMRGEKK